MKGSIIYKIVFGAVWVLLFNLEHQAQNSGSGFIPAEQNIKNSQADKQTEQGQASDLNIKKCQALYSEEKYDSLLAFLGDNIRFLSDSFGKKGNFHIYHTLGVYAKRQGLYALALRYFEEPLNFPGVDSEVVYSNVGIVWNDLGLASEALLMFNKAGMIAERKEHYIPLMHIWTNIAFLYIKQKEFDTAAFMLKKVYSLATKHDNTYGMLNVYWGMGKLYQQMGLYRKSLDYLIDSVKTLDSSQDYFVVLESLIGANYYYLKEFRKAERTLSGLYDNSLNYNKSVFLEIAPLVSGIYVQKGDYTNAYRVALKYNQVKDSLDINERNNIINAWIQTRMGEKDKEILRQELELVRRDNELKARNLWLVIGIGGILLLTALFIGMLRRHRHKVMRMEQEQEIARLRSLVRGEEQERNRIALELHNGIAGQVWAAKMEVEHLRQQATVPVQQEGLSTVYRYLQDTADEIRNTAHNLAPGLLLEEGLAKAVESFCEKAGQSSGITPDFSVCGHIPRLDQDIELLVFRIIQELVQNILKHAEGATRFLVQLGCSHDWVLNLTVEDDGSGFDRKKYTPGLGLKSISEKVAALGGYFDIRCDIGRGTTVYMELGVESFFPDKKVMV